jgi:hypothetical protein
MSLHHTIVSDPPASRRWRRYAPLLLVAGLTALALVPGLVSGDGPHEISLCGTQEGGLDTCAQHWRAALAEQGLMR